MPEPPFNIISCSWPRPVRVENDQWLSDPDWGAPLMPYQPQPCWQMAGAEICWMIDWREFFRGRLKTWDQCGEMRGFHLVFRLRVNAGGAFVFQDDDGSIIRRNGQIIHADRSAHILQRHEITVAAGDVLEVAQWQLHGDWLWGAIPAKPPPRAGSAAELLLPYLPRVQRKLADPNGPPLKFYTHGRTATRAVVAVYSLILNGYAPSQVLLFGEDQWSGEARNLLSAALPFAQVIPTVEVLSRAQSAGSQILAEYARRYWFAMKTCVALLQPPAEFCLMDDDVFILDNLADALDAYARNDLVYAPDIDHSEAYQTAWGWVKGQESRLSTGRFNAGLYWMRAPDDPWQVASRAIYVHPSATMPWHWEQGLIAYLYASRRTAQLPSDRYFYPLIDGLPGGWLGYDYRRNPCGFASIHFGGLGEKPPDDAMFYLAPEILD